MGINPNVPPAVTPPSPDEWPDTIRNISGITKAAEAQVTITSHGFTTDDVGVTILDFLQVRGMIQINGLPGKILSIVDSNNITVNINTTNFYTYIGGGYANIVAGLPPYDPFQNIA